MDAITREQARALDRAAQERLLLPGDLLMENAGGAVARHVLEIARCRGLDRAVIVAGPGNNGGDGFVAARHLLGSLAVDVLLLGALERLAGDAARNAERWRRSGGATRACGPDEAGADAFLDSALARGAVLVDALFGTGLVREVRGSARAWIERMNASGHPIVAVDVPSGLDADTGAVLGAAIRATRTVTFVAAKVGFLRAEGPSCCGNVFVEPIGFVPDADLLRA